MYQKWDIKVDSIKCNKNHLCKLNFNLKDKREKIKTWDICLFKFKK